MQGTNPRAKRTPLMQRLSRFARVSLFGISEVVHSAVLLASWSGQGWQRGPIAWDFPMRTVHPDLPCMPGDGELPFVPGPERLTGRLPSGPSLGQLPRTHVVVRRLDGVQN